MAFPFDKMGIDQHMRMGSDLMLFSGNEDQKVLSRLTPEQRQAAGISDGLVRVAVGLESLADIKQDLEKGLKRIG